MRIQHNIMAMNAYRNYNTNTSALSKNLEKLSSGYKINRAGDDAAGLAISEKMRAQITGLNAAQKNVKDGISLVKTAEGAMQEIQDMLNRMDYLATQSANGTYDNEVDRLNLNKEMDALKSEIDRIADSANFNGIKLLDGTQAAGDKDVIAAANETMNYTDAELTFAPVKDWKGLGDDADGVVGTDTILKKAGATEQAPEFTIDVGKISFAGDGTNTTAPTFDVTIGGATAITVSKDKDGNAFDKDTSLDAEGVAAAIAAAVNENNSGIAMNGDGDELLGVAIDGQAYKAEVVNGTQIKFTLVQKTDTANIPTGKTWGSEGDAAQKVKDGTANALQTPVKINNATNDSVFNTGDTITGGNIIIKPSVAEGDSNVASTVITLTADMITDGSKFTVGNKTYTFKVGDESKVEDGADTIDLSDEEEGSGTILEKAITKLTQKSNDNRDFTIGSNAAGKLVFTEKEGYKGEGDLTTEDGLKSNFKFKMAEKLTDEQIAENKKAADAEAAKGLTLQIGDTSDTFNQLKINIGDLHVKSMGTGKATKDGKEIDVEKSINDIDIKTQANAQEAVFSIRNAINYVSGIRGDLGAYQNRLEHTANNLSVMAENIQDAESTIRDTDVAEEMMAYTKNNILIQSAQAMLAQANAVPQGVLQLLG